MRVNRFLSLTLLSLCGGAAIGLTGCGGGGGGGGGGSSSANPNVPSVNGVNTNVINTDIAPEAPVASVPAAQQEEAATEAKAKVDDVIANLAISEGSDTGTQKDYTTLSQELALVVAKDPNNGAAQLAKGMVDVMAYVQNDVQTATRTVQKGSSNRMARAAMPLSSVLESFGISKPADITSDGWTFVDPPTTEGGLPDNAANLEEAESVVRDGLRNELIVMLGRLNKIPTTWNYEIDLSNKFGEVDNIKRTINYYDIALLRAAVALQIAFIEGFTATDLSDIDPNQFDKVDSLGNSEDLTDDEIINILDAHDTVGTPDSVRWAAMRTLVQKSWLLYQSARDDLRKRVPGATEYDGYLLTLARDSFDTDLERTDFLADEELFKTWAMGIYDSLGGQYTNTKKLEKRNLPESNGSGTRALVNVPAHEQFTIDFAKAFAGVNLRSIYYKKTAVGDERFLGISDTNQYTVDQATFGGVVPMRNGVNVTPEDASVLGVPNLVIDPKVTGTITLDGTKDAAYKRIGLAPDAEAPVTFLSGSLIRHAPGGVWVAQDSTALHVFFDGVPWDEQANPGPSPQIGKPVAYEVNIGDFSFEMSSYDQFGYGGTGNPWKASVYANGEFDNAFDGTLTGVDYRRSENGLEIAISLDVLTMDGPMEFHVEVGTANGVTNFPLGGWSVWNTGRTEWGPTGAYARTPAPLMQRVFLRPSGSN